MKQVAFSPRHMLMTADPSVGVWTFVFELAQALVCQNINISLAVMGGSLSREQKRELKHLPGIEVFESHFKLEWMNGGCDDIEQAGHWLMELERRIKPDLIHLNSHAHATIPFTAPKIITAHPCAALRWKDSPKELRDSYRQWVTKGLHSADLVVAPTRHALGQLETRHGSFPGKVIFHGRDPAKFLSARKEEFILVTGQLWDETQNLAALSLVAPEIPWSIYAAGEERSPHNKIVKYKSLEPLGKLPSDLLAKWYGRASVFALPARQEPCGSGVLEAALAGCALVLGDIPSLREIWSGVAIFVPPNNPDELKRVLLQLISNPIRRKEFASYAQCRAIQLTPHTMASQYIAAYCEARERHSTAPKPQEHAFTPRQQQTATIFSPPLVSTS